MYNFACPARSQEISRDRSTWIFPRCCARLLILVYGFMTGVSQASEDDDYWPGTVTVSAGMLAVVLIMIFPSWVLSLSIVQQMRRCCCPPRDLKFASNTSK